MTEQELDKMIARINELARKSKAEGLTEEEALEQTELRGKYIANFTFLIVPSVLNSSLSMHTSR